MVNVALQMKEAGYSSPLLIGGATTSKQHTAVKVAPMYFSAEHPVIHVLDASRAVGVVASLLDPTAKQEYVEDIAEEYEDMREDYFASLEDRVYLKLADASSKKLNIDFDASPPAPTPKRLGVTVLDWYSLEDVLPYIDWNPFFQTWELRGKYPNRGFPKIFNDADVGVEAKKLYEDAQTMLKQIVADKSLKLKGVLGLFPANRSANGEDVQVFLDEGARGGAPAHTFCGLRQQAEAEGDEVKYLNQSDFIAPSGHKDHLGMFAVSCFGCKALVDKHEADGDDYSKIMAQSLADRLVEAFAERLHKDIRTTLWGYAPNEEINAEDLLKIKYTGIRPAPGYPSQPDHTEKETMWAAIKAEELAGIGLSESLSMMPAASVSALVFAHPQSTYFAVGKVAKDQVESYAERKGQDVAKTERWLSPILAYDRS